MPERPTLIELPEQKLDNDYECWAILEGTFVEAIGAKHITIDDPDLVAVAERHGITLA